jgi:hypothetical protein
MKNIKLHVLVLAIVVAAELIGKVSFKVGVGSIVLLPMLYAMIIGLVLTIRKLKIVQEADMIDAGSLIGVTLMLLMAKYGTIIGPTLPKIIQASPALLLQEFGNLGTALLGVPVAVLIGLKREAIGGAHSIGREPNVALIGERFGLNSPEGQGVLGVYITGTLFGTVFVGLMANFLAAYTSLHPYALAMAAGVGSASMMTVGVGSLSAMFPDMADMIQAFGVSSNMLSGLDGLYMSIWLALPLCEVLYRFFYKLKYKESPPKPIRIDLEDKAAKEIV